MTNEGSSRIVAVTNARLPKVLLGAVFLFGGIACQSGGTIGPSPSVAGNTGHGGSGKGGGGVSGGGGTGGFTLTTVTAGSQASCGNGTLDAGEQCEIGRASCRERV